MTELRATDITIHAVTTPLVENASFSLKTGELVAMLGPNGAGKTTLLRAALGITPLTSGTAYLGNDQTHALSPMIRARHVAYLPQTRPLAWPNTVYDIVSLGRFSHGATLGRLQQADHTAVTRAISACDIAHLTERKADTLSGGELARVHCARAFAAEASLLVADEPVAALDPRHQFRVMDLIRDYVDTGGGGLVVLHDIALAARYADRLIWMKDGHIIADGPPAETLSEQRLADIYGVKARIEGTQVHIDGAL